MIGVPHTRGMHAMHTNACLRNHISLHQSRVLFRRLASHTSKFMTLLYCLSRGKLTADATTTT